MIKTFVEKSVWENFLENEECRNAEKNELTLRKVKYAIAEFCKADLAGGLIFAAALDMKNKKGKQGAEGAKEVSRIYKKLVNKCLPGKSEAEEFVTVESGSFFYPMGRVVKEQMMFYLRDIIEAGISKYGFFGVFSKTFAWLNENVPQSFPARSNAGCDYDRLVPKKFTKAFVVKSCGELVSSKKLAYKIFEALERIPVENETCTDKLKYATAKICALRKIEKAGTKLRKER